MPPPLPRAQHIHHFPQRTSQRISERHGRSDTRCDLDVEQQAAWK